MYTTQTHSTRQHGSIEEVPRGIEPVVFEMGGFDGLTFSNSYFFEKALGWHAIHLEASHTNFPRLVANRPLSTNLWLAACGEGADTVEFVENVEEGAVSGVERAMSERFRREWHGDPVKEVRYEVACMPLRK